MPPPLRPLTPQTFADQQAECDAAIASLGDAVVRFRREWTDLARRFGFENYDYDATMTKLKQGEASLNVVTNAMSARLEKFVKDYK